MMFWMNDDMTNYCIHTRKRKHKSTLTSHELFISSLVWLSFTQFSLETLIIRNISCAFYIVLHYKLDKIWNFIQIIHKDYLFNLIYLLFFTLPAFDWLRNGFHRSHMWCIWISKRKQMIAFRVSAVCGHIWLCNWWLFF